MTTAFVHSALRETFGAYLKARTLETFLAARDALVRSADYDPWSPELAQLDRYLEQQNWAAMRETALASLNNWMLTPYIHECLALAHQKLGDVDDARFEAALRDACTRGILMTGDGSPERPYLTVRQDDAYGALIHLGMEWMRERTVAASGRTLHGLVTSAGEEVWFDLSLAAARRRSRSGD